MELPLPPLAEQRRIVARIESLAAKIDEARGLSDEITSESERLYGLGSSAIFIELKAKHKSCPIGDTFDFRNDLIRPSDGLSGTIRFVGLQHIESNTGRKIGEDQIQIESLDGRKFKFSAGEIVYGYLRPYLNKVWIADGEGVCSVDQYVLKMKSNVVDMRYVAHYMRCTAFLEETAALTHNLMLPRLRSGLLREIPIPLPPLSEQRRIVTHLDALQARVDALKQLQAQSATELDALLPSVLDRAFKGEL